MNTRLAASTEKEKEEAKETTGHQVKGFPEPSAEDKAFMEALQAHQKDAPKLTFAEEIRSLVAYSNGFGVMSTNSATEEGYPSGSVVGFAVEDDGNLICSFSFMSSHTNDLLKDSRATLTVTAADFKGAADARVSIMGDCEKIPDEEREAATKKYLEKHEGAYWVQFGDFTWFRLQNIRAIRFVGGFARAGAVTPEDYAAAQPDPIAAFAAPVMNHMNEDHSDSTLAIVRHYTKLEGIDSADMVALDRLGMTVKCSRKGQFFKMRLGFPQEAKDRKNIKELLVEMTKAAAAGSA